MSDCFGHSERASGFAVTCPLCFLLCSLFLIHSPAVPYPLPQIGGTSEDSRPFTRPQLTRKTKNSVVGIIVQEHEPIDRALRRFKKKYERAGILKEYRRRTFFEKPSVKNKMLKQRAARRQMRIQEEAA